MRTARKDYSVNFAAAVAVAVASLAEQMLIHRSYQSSFISTLLFKIKKKANSVQGWEGGRCLSPMRKKSSTSYPLGASTIVRVRALKNSSV